MKHLPARRRAILALMTLAPLFVYFVSGQSQLQTGYTILTADPGSRIPVATALFTYSNAQGTMVSQAGAEATAAIPRGRIFVDEAGTRTGFAFVNPSAQDATVSLILRDRNGLEVARGRIALAAGRHVSQFVDEAFTNRLPGFVGSLTFESDQPLGAITLRENRNARNEPLYATLPVVDLSQTQDVGPAIFPHLAVGGGYTTQLVLINTSGGSATGRIRLVASDGMPLGANLGSAETSEFPYQIDGNGAFRVEFERPAGLKVGYAVLTPDPGTRTPSGAIVFQFKLNGRIVTEAGVAATPSTSIARLFIDNAGTRTGFAVVNPELQNASLTISRLDKNGAIETTLTRTLASGNHLAVFAHELFGDLVEGFTGVMEIRSSVPVVAIALKLTVNGRDDLVLTSLPVADLTRPSSASSLVFPHIAIGTEFSTRLIFLNTDPNSMATGRLNFRQSNGAGMTIPLGADIGSQFPYQLASSGGRQLFPGASTRISSISLIDPSSNRVSSELAVNEGSSVKAALRIIDTSGVIRDDIEPTYESLATNIATVDSQGRVEGRRAGFSTLTISAAGAVTAATITVARVDSGISGFQVTGVAQDLSRRLYLAATADHTILVTGGLTQQPVTYAGTTRTPGFRNDLRLQSQFRNPAFLAIHQADGNLYVADGANNVIRRVAPGPSGRTETLAGTGSSGSQDGTATTARFSNPQGVALDDRGNLWVVDSNNHTIRRIRLGTGIVETIAGVAGFPGFVDGAGNTARFRSPMGIAIETETPTQQLQRELSGTPPPPASVIVADTGNGVIRRVSENGTVETIRTSGASALSTDGKRQDAIAPPISLYVPTGVSVDAFGNIFVTEPSTGGVRVILHDGSVVAAAQPGTFRQPRGLAINETGEVIVADSDRGARRVKYGAPEISDITPDTVADQGGVRVTISGENFSSDSVVIAGGQVIPRAVRNTRTIVFTAPALPSGRTTLTVQNRGGIAQSQFMVNPVPLAQLSIGNITTVAGGTTFAGDGGPAVQARLEWPGNMAMDALGNLYLPERDRIRRIDLRTGLIHTVAGNGQVGSSGDGGPATAASFQGPNGVAVDSEGNLYIADHWNNRVRRVSAATGRITTIAGGDIGFAGDGGPANAARLARPNAVALDSVGNLYITDKENHRIRKIDRSTGIITTIAGSGPAGGAGAFSGDDGPATSARLNQPDVMTFDSTGNIYFVDSGNLRVRLITTGGIISTVAGTGTFGFSGNGGLAKDATFSYPFGLTVDVEGNLYIADLQVRRVDRNTGIITAVTESGIPAAPPRGSLATQFSIAAWKVVADGSGNLFVATGNIGKNWVVRVDLAANTIHHVAGLPETDLGDGGLSHAATFNGPEGIVFDREGNLLIADRWNHRIRKVDSRTQIITTIAGNGSMIGDGNPAVSSVVIGPRSLGIDSVGNIYIGEESRVQVINVLTGTMSSVAGMPWQTGFDGDGGPAKSAKLNQVAGLALDSSDNLYFSDHLNHRVRKVDARTRIVTTIAGNGTAGFSGDGGAATAASLNSPWGLVFDSSENLLIGDSESFRIRKIDMATGIITTVAGVGASGARGDNRPAISTYVQMPAGMLFDNSGNLWFANHASVQRISPLGLIFRIAGTGWYSFSGDNAPARDATFRFPLGVALDSDGNVYISDSHNGRIRAIRGPLP